MKITFKNIIALTLILVFQFSFAQKKEDASIGAEVVNVVKSYTPTISDATKVSETPPNEAEENTKKEAVNYSVFSFPVASTFTPSKGKAQGVDKEKQPKLYDNYATFGIGNYGVINGELFVNQELGNNDYVAGMFRHLSSQGGIKDVELKDSFYDTTIDLTYGVRGNDLSWRVDLGYQNQIYNWYGLPSDFANSLAPIDGGILIDGINPQQSYNTIYLGGKLDFAEGVVQDASLKFNHFSDAFGSSENRLYLKPALLFDIENLAIKTNVTVDYLGGSFENDYTNTNSIDYGFTNFGVAPSFAMQEDDWSFNLGLGVFLSLDMEHSESKFLVYPQIDASYKVVGDLMIFYAGLKGDLQQNSYADFVNQNPYLSPTLYIAPTDRQFDLFAGLKGKLANNIGYNIKGSYMNEKNRALFKSNDYTEDATNENYAFGNSLNVVYDEMKTISFYGELKADISDVVSFAIDGTFSSYTNDIQDEAWNLPAIQLGAKANFDITERWYAGANVFFVGERKDQKINLNNAATITPVTLDSYFDLNANVGFKYNERFTAFARFNNIANQDYQKWMDYQVQGFQAVIGGNYKFDF